MTSAPAASRVRPLTLLLALLAYVWPFEVRAGDNALAHMDLAMAVAIDGTTSIDRFLLPAGSREPNTCDWARAPSGRFHAAKAPGLGLLAAPPATALVALDRAAGRDPASAHALSRDAALLTPLLCALPVLLALRLLFDLSRALGASPGEAAFATLAVGLASPLHPYATILYAHAPAAACLGASLALLVRAASEGSPDGLAPGPTGSALQSHWRGRALATAAGLLAGMAVLLDYPAAVLVPALGLALLLLAPRLVPAFVLGGLPPLAALLGYHAAAFGSPFATAYAYQNPFFDAQGGVSRFHAPDPVTALELLVGPRRGILFHAPVLALAIPGAVALWRSGAPPARAVVVAAAGGLLANLALTAAYGVWWGGSTATPRFIVPALLLLLPLVAAAARGRSLLAGALLLVSLANAAAVSATTPLADERLSSPLTQWTYPAFAQGLTSRRCVLELLGLGPIPARLAVLGAALALAALLARAVRAVPTSPGVPER